MAEKVEIIAELKDLISGKFADINKQIDAMDSKLDSVGRKNSSGGGIMGQVLGANLLTGAITKAGSAMYQFGKDSFDAYGRAEQFQVSLKTLLYGNEQQANALNNQLKQFALESPFELTEIQQGTKMMVAYGSSAGSVVEEMRMLGDIGSGVGSSLSDIAYLYGTLRTQGIAYTRDLNQFTSRGIPIIKELAKQFHVADSEIRKMVEDGKVGFKDIEKAFQSMTAEGGQFNNMMAEQSKTLLGQTSNLADAWDQLKAGIGQSQSGILKGTISWATEMISQIRSIVDRGNYQDKAQAGVSKQNKVQREGFFHKLIATESGSDWNVDKRFYAGNLQNINSGKPMAGRREFDSEEMRDFFVEKHRDTYVSMGQASTERRFDQFTANWLKKSQDALSYYGKDLGKTKDLNTLINETRAGIIDQMKSGKMSASLAGGELNIMDQVGQDLKGAISLLKSDADKKAADAAQQPKKLEEVAKANKAVQVIVNIENLVRELTNVNQSASSLNQLTTDGTLKALTVAVNNIYAVGQ